MYISVQKEENELGFTTIADLLIYIENPTSSIPSYGVGRIGPKRNSAGAEWRGS